MSTRRYRSASTFSVASYFPSSPQAAAPAPALGPWTPCSCLKLSNADPSFFCSGGEEVMLDVAGQDASEEFEDIGHSDEAREQLEALQIGALKKIVSDPAGSTNPFSPPLARIQDGSRPESHRVIDLQILTLSLSYFRSATRSLPVTSLPQSPTPPPRPTTPASASACTRHSSSAVPWPTAPTSTCNSSSSSSLKLGGLFR